MHADNLSDELFKIQPRKPCCGAAHFYYSGICTVCDVQNNAACGSPQGFGTETGAYYIRTQTSGNSLRLRWRLSRKRNGLQRIRNLCCRKFSGSTAAPDCTFPLHCYKTNQTAGA